MISLCVQFADGPPGRGGAAGHRERGHVERHDGAGGRHRQTELSRARLPDSARVVATRGQRRDRDPRAERRQNQRSVKSPLFKLLPFRGRSEHPRDSYFSADAKSAVLGLFKYLLPSGYCCRRRRRRRALSPGINDPDAIQIAPLRRLLNIFPVGFSSANICLGFLSSRSIICVTRSLFLLAEATLLLC